MAVDQSPMNKLITKHIDIWTSAVKTRSTSGRGSSKKLELYGVKKLRELILELAVRGKLVPQDPNDEPASVLLERIAQEKAQLVKEKKLKKPKKLPNISDEEKPFDLPNGWSWIRLNEYGEWGSGSTPKRSNSGYYDGGIPWFKSGELKADYISESEETITELALSETSVRYNNVGDVLVAMYGATIGKTAILSVRATTNQAVCACTPFTGLSNTYLLTLLKAYKARLIGMGAGGAQPNISREKIINTVIALPSTAEQHRIVAKVDELMALCDLLEQQTESSIEAHQVLVTTLLDTLTNSADADELMQNWARISEHFDTLFVTEESIDQLKQTILQLAVMGKLVPQDPSDEHASELLKRIADEKAQLVKDKVYQKTSKLKPKNELISYPKGWVGVQTGQVCPSIVPNRDRPKSFTGNIPWVTLPAFPQQSLYLDSTKVELALTETEVQKYSARLIPEGSVLMSCVGRFGLTAINTIPVTSNQQVHAFITLKGLLSEYLSMVIRVEGKVLETVATSTTIAYLNKTNCESIQFGLPPENEQQLIVEKAKELIDLCEQLKVRVKESQATQHNLTDAIVEQAI
ncbi:restriction endonuclease subunit S [Vibrio vulnificus]|uniref:restriction endonuclease subunit S n=1 Tax=Vibrio TaxID=662 RepID=UPI00215D4DD9|nr:MULTISPECIES: restriction endonuclease subunit S [Vibrio]MCR9701887.1 restriction endonuclease subunit S [Vibrio vulnificus]MCX8861616.1 restriction endonuclease subunit S [Vibrio parahaemolyticus]